MRSAILCLVLELACAAALAAPSRALPAPSVPLSPGTLRSGARDLTVLRSGVPVEATVNPLAAGVEAQIMLDSQFVIDVPADAESLLLVLAADDERNDNFDFAVRLDAPVEVQATTTEADYWVMFPFGREELGLWGADLKAGRYYIAIITRSPTGGRLTLTATVDGVFVDAPPGAPVAIEVGSGIAGPEAAHRLDGQQYRFNVPADARDLLIELRVATPALDARFALQVGKPVEIDDSGTIIASRQIDARGGYGAVCLAESALPRDQLLFVWVLNAAEGILRGELALSVDGCTPALEPGTAFEGLVPRVPPLAPPGTIVLGETQYVIELESVDLRRCLHLEAQVVDGETPLSLLCRKGAPVRFESIAGRTVLAYDYELAVPPGATRFLVKPRCLDGKALHVVFGNRGAEVRRYTLALAAADCPFPYGRHPFLRGDANGDGKRDIGDAIHILGYLFLHAAPAPCMDALDGNDNGTLEIGDAITILQFLFGRGAPLAAPFTACGDETTPDKLDCADCRGCIPCVSPVATAGPAFEREP